MVIAILLSNTIYGSCINIKSIQDSIAISRHDYMIIKLLLVLCCNIEILAAMNYS